MSNNYYKILGLKKTATQDDIRRAYRTLARRYHPDVNPGVLSSERFKLIAEAYAVLNDELKRKAYDAEIGRKSIDSDSAKAFEAYKRNQSASNQNNSKKTAKERYYEAQRADYKNLKNFTNSKKETKSFKKKLLKLLDTPFKLNFGKKYPKKTPQKAFAVDIINTSLNLEDAINGIKKTIDLNQEGNKKIKVNIPKFSYNGSLIKVRESSTNKNYILQVNIIKHSFLEFEKRGIILKLPLTIREAMYGASIKVATFNGEVLIKVEKDTENGTELRLKSKGLLNEKGTREDLFVRLEIKTPKHSDDTNLDVASKALENFYVKDIRSFIPKKLI